MTTYTTIKGNGDDTRLVEVTERPTMIITREIPLEDIVGVAPKRRHVFTYVFALGTTQIMVLIALIKNLVAKGVDVGKLQVAFVAVDTDSAALSEAAELGVHIIRINISGQNVADFLANPDEYKNVLDILIDKSTLGTTGGGAFGIPSIAQVAYNVSRQEVLKQLRGIIGSRRQFKELVFTKLETEILFIVGGCGSTHGCLIPLMRDFQLLLKEAGESSAPLRLLIAEPSIFYNAADMPQKMQNYITFLLELSAITKGKKYPLHYLKGGDVGWGKFPFENIFVGGGWSELGRFVSTEEAKGNIASIAEVLISPFVTEEATRMYSLLTNLGKDYNSESYFFNGEPAMLNQISCREFGVNILLQCNEFSFRFASESFDGIQNGVAVESIQPPVISPEVLHRGLDVTGELKRMSAVIEELRSINELSLPFIRMGRDTVARVEANMETRRTQLETRAKALIEQLTRELDGYFMGTPVGLQHKLALLKRLHHQLDPSNREADCLSAQLKKGLGRMESAEALLSKLQSGETYFKSKITGFWHWLLLILGFKASAEQAREELILSIEDLLRCSLLRDISAVEDDMLRQLHDALGRIISKAEVVLARLTEAKKVFANRYLTMRHREPSVLEFPIITLEHKDELYRTAMGNDSAIHSMVAAELINRVGGSWSALIEGESDKIQTLLIKETLSIIEGISPFDDVLRKLTFYEIAYKRWASVAEMKEGLKAILRSGFTSPMEDTLYASGRGNLPREEGFLLLPVGPGHEEIAKVALETNGNISIIHSEQSTMLKLVIVKGKWPITASYLVKESMKTFDPEKSPSYSNRAMKGVVFNPFMVKRNMESKVLEDPLYLFLWAYALHVITLTKKQWRYPATDHTVHCLGENIHSAVSFIRNNKRIQADILSKIQAIEIGVTDKFLHETAKNFCNRWKWLMRVRRHRIEMADGEIPDGPVIVNVILEEHYIWAVRK